MHIICSHRIRKCPPRWAVATRVATKVAMHVQLLDFLQEMVFATPEELGEVKAETPEERAERAERVLTAALAGLAALTQALCPAPASKKNTSSSETIMEDSNGSASDTESPGQYSVSHAAEQHHPDTAQSHCSPVTSKP